jgi:murein DD-endopeptidase MepM/ murein hydrolase activator NlpD
LGFQAAQRSTIDSVFFRRAPRRRSHRFTIVIADRQTGVYRRVSLRLRPILSVTVSALLLPILIGLGLKWSAREEIAHLKANTEVLEVENQSYRAATNALTSQITALQDAIAQLGEKAKLDPATAHAIERLPQVVKSRAVGGSPTPAGPTSLYVPGLTAPDDTFGMLRDLLYSLESRLRAVEVGVERQQALADATPSIWPAHGWLTDSFGRRSDPFTGAPEFHTGLDISTEKGQPVVATANGTVQSAARNGAYGNMVVIDHGFGLVTRYAHLQGFNVKPGDVVKRGDVIGFAGSTGRATGDHVHYEVLANSQMLNPLRFLLNRVGR